MQVVHVLFRSVGGILPVADTLQTAIEDKLPNLSNEANAPNVGKIQRSSVISTTACNKHACIHAYLPLPHFCSNRDASEDLL